MDLPTETQTGLEAEAARRGVTVAELIAQIASAFSDQDDPLEAFIGSGSSGRGDLARRHREIRADQTAGLSARDL